MKKERRTILDRKLRERSKIVDLHIRTRVPEKWVFIDVECEGVWVYSGKNKPGEMFKKADQQERNEAISTLFRIDEIVKTKCKAKK